MDERWAPDPATDALFARVAVLVTEAEQQPVGPLLASSLVRLQGLQMDCTTAARVTALWDRLASWVQAQSMICLAEALRGADLPDFLSGHDAAQIVAQDIAVMTHVSFGSSMERVAMVERIGDALPLSWEALNRGDLTLAHLKVLSTSTRACTPRVAEAVDARVVPQAIARGWTPTQLANAARRAVIALDPDGAEDRAAKAKQYGDVSLYAEDHECATLVATGDAVPLRNVMDAIEQRAEALGRTGDVRPVGQRRIDALAQYVLGEQAAARPAIQAVVTIDLTTLLGLTERPGELSGYGPITAETARQLSKDATLRRLITDPMTGTMIDLGTSYRPTAALRRIIDARDRTCRFPGCSRRAITCDADHAIAHGCGGRTRTDNLHALCRMHHNLKTHGLWSVTLNPDGTETWTSAFGFRYTTQAGTYPIELFDPPDEDPPPDHDEWWHYADSDPPSTDDGDDEWQPWFERAS